MNGEKAEGFNVELSDTLALVYEAENPDIGGK
jgi:hypothetical protein